MSDTSSGWIPLFIDTGAFIGRFNNDDQYHDRANAVFDGIESGELPYRPLYTSRYVLSELATRLVRGVGHAVAVTTLDAIRESDAITVLPVTDAVFANACNEFARYDDHTISFVDHTTGVLARERDIDRVFAFDSDFRTLGLTMVPADTGER